MTVVLLLFVAVCLLLLNAFFVLAEFASVKVRSTQIDVLMDQGVARAKTLRHIHSHLDEYLSVCQLGITFASIGLGFVGEPAIARLLEPWLGSTKAAHTVAITISYILISYLHILIGELVPKSIAIRAAEKSALFTALPLRFFHALFYIPLFIMNGSANTVLRLLRLPVLSHETAPSEAEVRLILEHSQKQGLMPFRRLLLMENVFDFGDVHVRDAMTPMTSATALRLDAPWEQNQKILTESHFSRYPLLEGNPPRVVGVFLVKDLIRQGTPWPAPVDLRSMARPAILTTPDKPLESLMTEFRRKRTHMALVQDIRGNLCGLITMEDILEQLVGSIEDEFEQGAVVRLADTLNENRILLDLEAETSLEAIREIIMKIDTKDIPATKPVLVDAVIAREKSLSTYLGHELAVPHARLENLKAPCLFVARSIKGVRFDPASEERAQILFLLLTPSQMPKIQVRLLARIAALRESDYVWDRLLNASSPVEVVEAIRGGDELTVN